jgi:hypothetical protein
MDDSVHVSHSNDVIG